MNTVKPIQLLARTNPALWPKAQSEEIAKAKIVAAGLAARMANSEVERESARGLLTLASDIIDPWRGWLDSVTQEMGVQNLPVGSGRQNAKDCGGRVGRYLQQARRAKLGLITLPDAALLAFAFPGINTGCRAVESWITERQFFVGPPDPLALSVNLDDWMTD